MQYVGWSIVALVAYAFVAPLVRVGTREIPIEIAVVITNSILIVMAIGMLLMNDVTVNEYLGHEDLSYLVLGGLFLGIGIIAYYRALSLGPVSIVVPIYGMFLVLSSAAGIFFLHESVTTRRLAGIGLGVLAIYLTASG